MIIQHNLSAMNTANQYKNISKNMAKCTEKLSSGYRINRAADDAAGLPISEKMRYLIRGLNRASDNAEDGISMIQTAESALGDVQDIINRMSELCVKSANDTNTDEDISAIDDEISSLIEEIDRISTDTSFNSKTLLDGSCSASGISSTAKNDFISWLNGSWLNDAAVLIDEATGWTLQSGTTLEISFQDIADTTVATMSGYYGGTSLTLTINTDFILDDLTYNGTDGPYIGGILADRVIAHEMVHALMLENTSSTASPDNWFIEGIAEAVHGASDVRYSAYELGLSTDYSAINDDIQSFDFANNQSGYDTYTVGYLATSYLYQMIEGNSTGSFKTMLAEMDESDETFQELVVKYTGAASYEDFYNGFKQAAQDALDNGTFETDFLESLCNIDLTDGLADSIGTDDADASGAVPNDPGTSSMPSDDITTISLDGVNVTVNWNPDPVSAGVWIQLGAKSGQGMMLSFDDTSAAAIGVSDLSAATRTDAENGISTCQDALKIVSSIRSSLGAYQNRLEHAINSIDNQAENLQDAESKIRDTDMADYMVQYSKNNILMQVAQSMLSHSNNDAENVLMLLQ